MISVIFPIEPVAKGRPRFGNGRTYTPAKTVRFENAIRMMARKLDISMLSGPLAVSVDFVLPKPRTSKNAHPQVKPDLDNFVKAIFDSLNGLWWKDDSQICEVTARKFYAVKPATPFIEIDVRKL